MSKKMEEKQDKLILVYYISITHVDDIEEYIGSVMKKITSTTVSEDSEILVIPIYGETRIDCINPKYITDGDLIKKHERLMSELHEKLKNQINQIEDINIKTNEG
jgi:hypothetical protein